MKNGKYGDKMKKLFLCSAFAEVSNYLSEFVGTDLAGQRVTFITTASLHEEMNFFVDEAQAAFEQLGMGVDLLEVTAVPTAEATALLVKNPIIYIAGGNTFFLLQELRRTGLDQVILAEIVKGTIYIGESAGAIIMSPDIDYIALMDNVKQAPELTSSRGLGLLAEYLVPHAKNSFLSEYVHQIIHTYGQERELLLLQDTQALLINGDAREIKSN